MRRVGRSHYFQSLGSDLPRSQKCSASQIFNLSQLLLLSRHTSACLSQAQASALDASALSQVQASISHHHDTLTTHLPDFKLASSLPALPTDPALTTTDGQADDLSIPRTDVTSQQAKKAKRDLITSENASIGDCQESKESAKKRRRQLPSHPSDQAPSVFPTKVPSTSQVPPRDKQLHGHLQEPPHGPPHGHPHGHPMKVPPATMNAPRFTPYPQGFPAVSSAYPPTHGGLYASQAMQLQRTQPSMMPYAPMSAAQLPSQGRPVPRAAGFRTSSPVFTSLRVPSGNHGASLRQYVHPSMQRLSSDQSSAYAAQFYGHPQMTPGSLQPQPYGQHPQNSVRRYGLPYSSMQHWQHLPSAYTHSIPYNPYTMPGGAMPGGAMTGGAMTGGAMTGGAMTGGAMTGGNGMYPSHHYPGLSYGSGWPRPPTREPSSLSSAPAPSAEASTHSRANVNENASRNVP